MGAPQFKRSWRSPKKELSFFFCEESVFRVLVSSLIFDIFAASFFWGIPIRNKYWRDRNRVCACSLSISRTIFFSLSFSFQPPRALLSYLWVFTHNCAYQRTKARIESFRQLFACVCVFWQLHFHSQRGVYFGTSDGLAEKAVWTQIIFAFVPVYEWQMQADRQRRAPPSLWMEGPFEKNMKSYCSIGYRMHWLTSREWNV